MAHTTEIMVNGVLTQVTEFEHSAQEIDDAVDALGGAKTPQEALANLGAGVRPNLLDNWDFRNPVNQRSKTTYNTNGQVCVDRWTLYDNASVSVIPGAVSIQTGAISQLVEKSVFDELAGKTVTISALLKDGTLGTATGIISDSGTATFISANIGSGLLAIALLPDYNSYQLARLEKTGEVVAVKVEEGTNQTLAYQKPDGKWELLPQPDSKHSQVLAECQMYQIELNPQRLKIPTFAHAVRTSNSVYAIIPIPVTMRTSPVISITGGDAYVEVKGGDQSAIKIKSFNVLSVSAGMVTCNMTLDGEISDTSIAGVIYVLGAGTVDDAPRILLDANL